MSTEIGVHLPCGQCQKQVRGRVAVLINFEKSPEWEARLLADDLNRLTCGCGFRMTYMRTVGTVDFARKTCAYGYPSSLEVYWQDLGLAVEAAFRRNWVVGAPPVVRATASEWRVRAVMGYEGLREQRVISLAGLDDVQVETTKLHLLAGRPEWAGARVWLRAVSADRLLFRVDTLDVSQRAAADVPREWLSLPAPDHVLPGALDADPFVSFRKLWIRPKPVPPDLVRLDGRWEVYTTQVDQREPVIRF